MRTCVFRGGPLNGEVREMPEAPAYLMFPKNVQPNILIQDVADPTVDTMSWRDVVYERTQIMTTTNQYGRVVQQFFEYEFRG